MLLEKALSQEKLWVKVLLLGSIIDNRNSTRRPRPSLQDPLILEHVQDRRIEVIAPGSRQRRLDLGAAGALGLNQ